MELDGFTALAMQRLPVSVKKFWWKIMLVNSACNIFYVVLVKIFSLLLIHCRHCIWYRTATLLFVVNIINVYMRWILPAKLSPSFYFSCGFPLWNKGTALMSKSSAGTSGKWICCYCLCSPEQALRKSTPVAAYGFECGYLSCTYESVSSTRL